MIEFFSDFKYEYFVGKYIKNLYKDNKEYIDIFLNKINNCESILESFKEYIKRVNKIWYEDGCDEFKIYLYIKSNKDLVLATGKYIYNPYSNHKFIGGLINTKGDIKIINNEELDISDM